MNYLSLLDWFEANEFKMQEIEFDIQLLVYTYFVLCKVTENHKPNIKFTVESPNFVMNSSSSRTQIVLVFSNKRTRILHMRINSLCQFLTLWYTGKSNSHCLAAAKQKKLLQQCKSLGGTKLILKLMTEHEYCKFTAYSRKRGQYPQKSTLLRKK